MYLMTRDQMTLLGLLPGIESAIQQLTEQRDMILGNLGLKDRQPVKRGRPPNVPLETTNNEPVPASDTPQLTSKERIKLINKLLHTHRGGLTSGDLIDLMPEGTNKGAVYAYLSHCAKTGKLDKTKDLKFRIPKKPAAKQVEPKPAAPVVHLSPQAKGWTPERRAKQAELTRRRSKEMHAANRAKGKNPIVAMSSEERRRTGAMGWTPERRAAQAERTKQLRAAQLAKQQGQEGQAQAANA